MSIYNSGMRTILGSDQCKFNQKHRNQLRSFKYFKGLKINKQMHVKFCFSRNNMELSHIHLVFKLNFVVSDW